MALTKDASGPVQNLRSPTYRAAHDARVRLLQLFWEEFMKSKTEKDARRAAEDARCDHTLLVVSPADYAAFVKRLDKPPTPNARLRRTMQTSPPWEREKR